MSLFVSAQPEITSDHRTPDHDDDIRYIENACVKRADANENKIANESMPRNAINHVAHSTRPNQSKPNKDKPTKATSEHKIRQQADQTDAYTNGKY
jgi:hypothetical protein